MKGQKKKLLTGSVKTTSLLVTVAIIIVGGAVLKLLADGQSRVEY